VTTGDGEPLPKTLAPKDVAPYSDAGLTAYRAVKKVARQLNPGESCVMIGAGGVGHIGIQCPRAMSPADIIVVDKSEASLELAKKVGAHKLVKADGNEVEAVLELTGGQGAEAVVDFVGEKGTTAKGLKMTRPMGSYYVVGYGEDIRVPTVDMVITERNIIGNLVGTTSFARRARRSSRMDVERVLIERDDCRPLMNVHVLDAELLAQLEATVGVRVVQSPAFVCAVPFGGIEVHAFDVVGPAEALMRLRARVLERNRLGMRLRP
jgi:threonine dehydrogenase-like Zn-dependent dehydrogenase